MACVVHDSAQQTLEQLPGRRPRDLAASLGLPCVAAWLAFERSTRVKAPVATSLRLTFQLFRELERHGVYEFDLENRGPTVRRAIYEPFTWRDGFVCLPSEELEALLLERLRQLCAAPGAQADKQAMWQELATAEAESYLATQLRKHGFDAGWAERLLKVLQPEWEGITLARRRYLAWAGVRQGAAAYLQSAGDTDLAFASILTELRRRGRWLAANEAGGQSTGNDFLPFASWTRPLLLDIFLAEILPIDSGYWTKVPGAR